jgi:hypothetical protein
MPRLSLGLNQRNFNGSTPTSAAAINMGSMRGKASTSRMFNFCKTHSPAPSLCIDQFINITGSGSGNVVPGNTVPGAPTITSINPGLQSLVINYTPPSIDGGSPIFDYKYSIDSGNTYQSFGSVVNPFIINNLTIGQTYYVSLKAVNAVGDSLPSNTLTGIPTNWAPMGDGFSYTVQDIIPYGANNIYAVGNFTNDNQNIITYNRMANWTISTESWSQVINNDGGIGISGGPVNSFVQIPNTTQLYAGGDFDSATNSTTLNSIGIFDTSTGVWSSVNASGSNAGTNGGVRCLVYNTYNNFVYFGGYMTLTTTGSQLNHIASINTSDASPKPINNITVSGNIGLNNQVLCMTVDNNNNSSPYYGDVYVGGIFTGNGLQTLNKICVYTPSTNSWSQLGSGLDGNVFSVTLDPNNSNLLYVGGSFTQAISVSNLRNIGIYNRQTDSWQSLPSGTQDGPNDTVRAIAIANNGDIYVGGSFNSLIINSSSIPAYNIAKYNTTNGWSALDVSVGGDVYTITVGQTGELYIGGEFAQVFVSGSYYDAKYIYKYIPQ